MAGETYKKLGIQFQWDSPEALRFDSQAQPVAVMGIEVDKADYWRQFSAPIRIWRHHPNRPWSEEPERQAKEAVVHIAGRIRHLLDAGLITHVTDNNEFILGVDHVSPDLIKKADRYISTFISSARAELGVGTCWGNFNTGHWGPETVEHFPRSLQAAVADGDSPICWHEYNWPLMRDDTLWTCGKFLRAMPPILEKYPGLQCGITETGLDDGGHNPEKRHWGWRKAFPTYEECLDQFTLHGDGLDWYNVLLNSADWLRFALIFGCGMFSDWDTFDIANSEVIERIKAFPSVEIPPGNGNSGNGGYTMSVKVFDRNGMELSEAAGQAMIAKYGIAWRRADVPAGDPVWRLVEFWEKSGPSAHVTTTLDEDGKPLENIDVAFRWASAEEVPEDQRYPTDHYINFVHGLTNKNGDVGPGMGGGAATPEGGLEPGNDGPHQVWVRDPNIPSDLLYRIGWLAMTPHDHLDCKFQRVLSQGADDGDGGSQPPPAGAKVIQVDLQVKGTITL